MRLIIEDAAGTHVGGVGLAGKAGWVTGPELCLSESDEKGEDKDQCKVVVIPHTKRYIDSSSLNGEK